MHNLGAMFGHIVKAIQTPVEPGANGAVTEQVRHERQVGPVASPMEGYVAQGEQEVSEQVTRHADGRVVAERTQTQRLTMTPEAKEDTRH